MLGDFIFCVTCRIAVRGCREKTTQFPRERLGMFSCEKALIVLDLQLRLAAVHAASFPRTYYILDTGKMGYRIESKSAAAARRNVYPLSSSSPALFNLASGGDRRTTNAEFYGFSSLRPSTPDVSLLKPYSRPAECSKRVRLSRYITKLTRCDL